jgi:hypothetical protein
LEKLLAQRREETEKNREENIYCALARTGHGFLKVGLKTSFETNSEDPTAAKSAGAHIDAPGNQGTPDALQKARTAAHLQGNLLQGFLNLVAAHRFNLSADQSSSIAIWLTVSSLYLGARLAITSRLRSPASFEVSLG